MYIRKTHDEYTIWGNYGYGWEELCAYTKRSECLTDLRLYRKEQPGAYKVTRKRVKNDHN